jgi:hypothetical protein
MTLRTRAGFGLHKDEEDEMPETLEQLQARVMIVLRLMIEERWRMGFTGVELT